MKRKTIIINKLRNELFGYLHAQEDAMSLPIGQALTTVHDQANSELLDRTPWTELWGSVEAKVHHEEVRRYYYEE